MKIARKHIIDCLEVADTLGEAVHGYFPGYTVLVSPLACGFEIRWWPEKHSLRGIHPVGKSLARKPLAFGKGIEDEKECRMTADEQKEGLAAFLLGHARKLAGVKRGIAAKGIVLNPGNVPVGNISFGSEGDASEDFGNGGR